ncbi:hypothetical protein ACFRFQ_14200 [Rhodococcus sp. NPDC056743]|uniref:hypothetical protein n=1 Tax=Rhodococcus sp. NPDC056743 TaxID=3345934 RepID=UPI00367199A5
MDSEIGDVPGEGVDGREVPQWTQLHKPRCYVPRCVRREVAPISQEQSDRGGQIFGPLVVTPLLRDGYCDALLLSSAIVLAVAVAAVALPFRSRSGPSDGYVE